LVALLGIERIDDTVTTVGGHGGSTYRDERRSASSATEGCPGAAAPIWWDGPVPDALPAPDTTLADLGEFGLIDRVSRIVAEVAPGEEVLVGPGDDAAVLRVRKGHVVVSTDLMVEGRHFRKDWADPADVGHRAAAQNISDINAMGGRALWLTVGLAAPPTLEARWALELVRGFAEECALVGAGVVGGDVTSSDKITLAVTVMGACTVSPVLRSGAGPGDVVALCGRQGWAAGGLAVLGRGFRSPRVLVDAYRRPEPPYGAGVVAAEGGATSMIDVSDGLLADAAHVAAASGVGIDIETATLEVPEPLVAVAGATGADPLTFVLGGGDDHSLLATFPADSPLPEGWRRIGTVTGPGPDGPTVTVDGSPYDGPTGWTHF
jgi:thiamine-monophosphate kinase